MVILGAIIVVCSTLGGFAAMGGHLLVLWQPFEFVIIVGSAIGAFLIANPSSVVKHVIGTLKVILQKQTDRNNFTEILGIQFAVFKLAKTKGMLALETHFEKPHDSPLFKHFDKFLQNASLLAFFTDYLRIVTMGSENPDNLESLMESDIEAQGDELHNIFLAVQNVADGMPALGIVAAVLGVIKTMGSIDAAPQILGKMIGGALVGTFLGVFIAYGFIGPIANIIRSGQENRMHCFKCIKVGLLSHIKSMPPMIAVEFARKSLPPEYRPSFAELEAFLDKIPSF